VKDGKRRRAKALRLPDTAAFEQAAAIRGGVTKKEHTDLREVRRHLEATCYPAGKQTTCSGVFYTYVMRSPKKPKGAAPRVLWHGTPLKNLPGILSRGLSPSWGGLLGPGVYFGGRQKAELFMRDPLGALLQCEVSLGECADAIPDVGAIRNVSAYDSIHGVPGATNTLAGLLRMEEWAVRNPERVSIKEIRVFASRAGHCTACGRMSNLDEMRSSWSASAKDFVYLCTNCC